MSAAITLDMSELVHLDRLLTTATGKALITRLLDQIGASVEATARERITDSKGIDGRPWAPWSEKYAKRVKPHQTLLLDSQALLDSLTHVVDGTKVLVGSNLVYAATHQYGDDDRNIPARPFLGADRDEVTKIIQRWGEELFGGRS